MSPTCVGGGWSRRLGFIHLVSLYTPSALVTSLIVLRQNFCLVRRRTRQNLTLGRCTSSPLWFS